jgi:UDP-2,3-diacylglucosamine hydrolase
MILFISDLHLSDASKETVYFHKFLTNLPSQVSALYILGDLFEMWIGDDDLDAFATAIINSIRAVTARGIAVYFQHGNRDFFIGFFYR